MGLNFQDVIRDVHDTANHALQISGTINAAGQATVNINGSATLFAVVNTAAAGQASVVLDTGTRWIGLATVYVGGPTLFAVVNTAAAGEASIALDSSVSKIGFTTTFPAASWPDPKTYIGLVTVTGNFGTTGNVTLDPGSRTGIVGNLTLSDPKTYIGLTTSTIGSMPSVLASGQYFPTLQSVASGALAPLAVDAKGELLLGDPKGYIGSVSVSGVVGLNTGNLNIGSVSVLGGTINSTLQSSTLNVGSVSVLGGTINANLQTGTLNIGSVSILGGKIINDTSTLNIGSVSVLGGTINSTLQSSTLNVGSVSVLGGGIGINTGINNIGFASVTPVAAWPDPKTYIGLVTITGSLAAASGNVTITDGKTFIGSVSVTGNVGLTAGVANIGFASVTPVAAWPDPHTYIGLVTITGSLAAASGNVTLDPGSKTQIVGNVTLSDAKTFIGLVSIQGSVNANLQTGTLNIGSVSILGGKIVNDTSTLNIGSVSVLGGVINTNLNSGTLNIGSVSVLGGLIGIAGNVTLSDSKTFVGLVTVKASILDTFASLATFTMSIASLATSTSGVGRQSTLIDNTVNNYSSANIYLKIFTGGLAHTPNTLVNVYLLRRDNNSVGDDGAGASDAAITITNAPLLGNLLISASLVSTAYQASFDTSPLGPLGPQWGIALVNQTGAALGGTEGNHLKNWIGVNKRLT